jgi:hypothetical protein
MAKTKTKEKATTFIQWKGTVVCMDVHCPCGHHGHIDAGFAYYYQCPKCEQIYKCGDTIELSPVDKPDSNAIAVGDYVGAVSHIPYNELMCELNDNGVDMSRVCDKRFERPEHKPIKHEKGYFCVCDNILAPDFPSTIPKPNYCDNCGRKLDWNDE